jgi:hypothetical protein
MEQSFNNKITCDISMNEIRMKDKPFSGLEENGSLQI